MKGEASDIMDAISVRKGITKEDIGTILKWTNERDADFLLQYSGPGWTFPLTEEQITNEMDREYSVFEGDTFVGMMQLISKENNSAYMGRFLLDPEKTGRGIGAAALSRFCEILFNDDPELEEITLKVFAFNKSAQQCYRNCGFEVSEEYYENGEMTHMEMKKLR